MKTKILYTTIALLCCLSCRTIRESAASESTSKTGTSVSQQDTRTGSEDVSVAASGKTETDTQKSESEESFAIKFFPPDSTGRQPVAEISGTKKQADTSIKQTSKWEASVSAQLDYLHTKIDELEQQINASTTSETVYKTGFTLLEKVGIGTLILLLLSAGYGAFKLYSKFRK